jgi:D-alanine-D-alanine ligase
MRVLVLHSDVAPNPLPDELDTLLTAKAVANALEERGHEIEQRAFIAEPAALDSILAEARPDIVFNLVESVFGQGDLACLSASMLERRRVPFTGASAVALASLANKPHTKRILQTCGLPTPEWAEPPRWEGLVEDRHDVVKSANEDASLGLDDAAVVAGSGRVRARAAQCMARHGGAWFAEAYLAGREFNISLLEEAAGLRVLPIAEIQFENWASDRPRVVGYAAKWDPCSPDNSGTPRVFGIEKQTPSLAHSLAELSCAAWRLFSLSGYARVDFRLDAEGAPMILEINPNPCLEPEAGFAAAAAEAGISYSELVERILNLGAETRNVKP